MTGLPLQCPCPSPPARNLRTRRLPVSTGGPSAPKFPCRSLPATDQPSPTSPTSVAQISRHICSSKHRAQSHAQCQPRRQHEVVSSYIRFAIASRKGVSAIPHSPQPHSIPHNSIPFPAAALLARHGGCPASPSGGQLDGIHQGKAGQGRARFGALPLSLILVEKTGSVSHCLPCLLPLTAKRGLSRHD